MKEARAASPQRCSSNANSLRGQNSAGFPEIRATSKGIFCDDISEFELTCPARQSRLCGSGCSRSCRPDLGGSGCRVHGRTIQIRDSYCGSPWRQLQLDKVGKSRSFIFPVISDLRRLIRPSLPLPFPVNPLHLLGKYEPAGRRFFECALYPRILCSRRALFGLGRSLSVHIRTQRHTGRTPGKTARFLKCTEPRASRRVDQLVVTPPLTRGRPCPDPLVVGGPTAKSGAPGPSSSHAGQGAPTHPTATTENRND
jgi:hypothetical protein